MRDTDSESAVRSAIAKFNDRQMLARASDLALAGHLVEAEALVRGDCEKRLTPAGFDLIARIRVSQGQFERAQEYWEKSLEEGGDKKQILNCLDTLADYQKLILERRLLFWKLGLCLWISITGFILWAFFAW